MEVAQSPIVMRMTARSELTESKYERKAASMKYRARRTSMDRAYERKRRGHSKECYEETRGAG